MVVKPPSFFINILYEQTHYEYTQRNFALHLATSTKSIGIDYASFYETLYFKRKV